MAGELVFLTCSPASILLSAIVILILCAMILEHKMEDDVEPSSTEATKEKDTVKQNADNSHHVDLQYVNMSLMSNSLGPSGGALDSVFKRNGKYPLPSADYATAHNANTAERNWDESSAAILPSAVPRGVFLLEGAWQVTLCSEELYRQLMNYTLTPLEMFRCGYPPLIPKKPPTAKWSQGKRAYLCRKTCNRCGSIFFITSDREYYATDACLFHSRRRSGRVFSCCGASAEKPGCQFSDYHICTEGAPRKNNTPADDFVRTQRRPGVPGSVFALDCEMCFTIHGLEVTKVSVVNWNGDIVYDSYVKPSSPVLDYNTAFSGVTAEHLQNVQTTLQDVQTILLRLFTASTVLVGHGLENDLSVLKLLHNTVVDTAVVFPHDRGLPYRRSLRSLVGTYLNREVQAGSRGHDSTEDARACMDLVMWKAAHDLKQRQGHS